MGLEKECLFWELGEVLAKRSWSIGECISSPQISSTENTNWVLNFYPAGDDDVTGLVFELVRENADTHIGVKLQLHLCHYTTPVKSYTVEHIYEIGEASNECLLVDVANLAKLSIFIPTSTLCVRVFLTIQDV